MQLQQHGVAMDGAIFRAANGGGRVHLRPLTSEDATIPLLLTTACNRSLSPPSLGRLLCIKAQVTWHHEDTPHHVTLSLHPPACATDSPQPFKFTLPIRPPSQPPPPLSSSNDAVRIHGRGLTGSVHIAVFEGGGQQQCACSSSATGHSPCADIDVPLVWLPGGITLAAAAQTVGANRNRWDGDDGCLTCGRCPFAGDGRWIVACVGKEELLELQGGRGAASDACVAASAVDDAASLQHMLQLRVAAADVKGGPQLRLYDAWDGWDEGQEEALVSIPVEMRCGACSLQRCLCKYV